MIDVKNHPIGDFLFLPLDLRRVATCLKIAHCDSGRREFTPLHSRDREFREAPLSKKARTRTAPSQVTRDNLQTIIHFFDVVNHVFMSVVVNLRQYSRGRDSSE